jgi:hypothetical protein
MIDTSKAYHKGAHPLTDSIFTSVDVVNTSAKQEISQFSRKECTYMPGSKTTQGRTGARTIDLSVLPSATLTASAP